MNIPNSAVDINLELDALEKMSVRVAFRLGLADTFCCWQVYFKVILKLLKTNFSFP